MATSSVPSVKAGLLTIMRAAVGTIQCEWAHPGQYIAKESIFMDDAQGCEERAWALVALAETPIRTAGTLGVPNVHWARVTGKTPQGYMTDQGRAYSITLSVGVQARI